MRIQEAAAVGSTLVPPARPLLGHGHDWRLRDVEYVDGLQAQRFECDGCGDVLFR